MVKILDNLMTIRYFSNHVRKSFKEMSSVCNEVEKNVDNSINYLINMHPKFYRDSLKFEDWDSSMRFLKDKKEEAFNFWNHDGN